MDVLTTREGIDEARVLGEVSDAAQFDLVVVRYEQHTARGGDERLAELPAFLAAHRDVVEVRLVRAEATRPCNRLVEGGVNPSVGGNLGEEPLPVRGAQLLKLPVLEQGVDELRPLVAQFLERLCVGGEPGFGLLDRGKAALAEQDLAELDSGVEVELAPCHEMHLGHEPLALRREALVERAQFRNVHGDTVVLHFGEHPNERVLDVPVERIHTLRLERSLNGWCEPRHGERCATRTDRVVHRGVAEVQLAARCTLGREHIARVSGEQFAEGVPTLGRVQQVCGDHGVEREVMQVHTQTEQRAHQGLGVVRSDGAPVVERSDERGIAEHARRDPQDLGEIRVCHDGEPAERRATGLARPCARKVERRAPCQCSDRLRGTACGADLGLDGIRSVRPIGGIRVVVPRADHQTQPVEQRPELEEVEQSPHLDHVRVDLGLLNIHGDRGIPAKQHQVVVHARLCLVGGERLAKLGGLRPNVPVDAVQIAVGVDEFRGRLLPNPGHTRQVVTRVPAQRRVLRILLRGDPGALEDAGLVVERVVTHAALVVQHTHERVLDELITVPVPRDNDDVVARVAHALDHRCNEVVGLPARCVERSDAQCREYLPHQAHLLTKDVGARLALGLVRRVSDVAERRLGPVERSNDRLRMMILDEVDEHRGEAVHRVGDLPRCRGHVGRQGEKRPIGEGVPVQQ
ncbi:unannotated protein [freshwater metagenome]|uniref:Unannotated protein n=1 Tax=freshwater metagenome TaxID=449393 RepID=A0A6J6ZYQ9_9ZZZZ